VHSGQHLAARDGNYREMPPICNNVIMISHYQRFNSSLFTNQGTGHPSLVLLLRAYQSLGSLKSYLCHQVFYKRAMSELLID
jgi:hypothetical protein